MHTSPNTKEFHSTTPLLLKVFLALLLYSMVGLGVMGINTNVAYAADGLSDQAPFELYAKKFTFSAKTSSYNTYIPSVKDGYSNGITIKKIKSSKPSVASAKMESSGKYIWPVITPKKAGKTVITCTDQYGRTAKITVNVKKNYFKANLKTRSSSYATYGKKVITAYTAPKAKVTLKLNGKKVTKRANKNGQVTFKTSKLYKLNTKYSVTFKTGKATVTKSFKFGSSAWARSGHFRSCWCRYPMTIYNATKGDKVIVKLGSRTYTYTIPYSTSSYSLTVYTDYRMGNYTSAKITIKNKYGQKLYSTMDRWTWR